MSQTVIRRVEFAGNRADALEHLPSACARERIELGRNRISMVCGASRIDVHILEEHGPWAATELDAPAPTCTTLADERLLLELRFSGHCVGKAATYVERLDTACGRCLVRDGPRRGRGSHGAGTHARSQGSSGPV